jgi:hypothetical protein
MSILEAFPSESALPPPEPAKVAVLEGFDSEASAVVAASADGDSVTAQARPFNVAAIVGATLAMIVVTGGATQQRSFPQPQPSKAEAGDVVLTAAAPEPARIVARSVVVAEPAREPLAPVANKIVPAAVDKVPTQVDKTPKPRLTKEVVANKPAAVQTGVPVVPVASWVPPASGVVELPPPPVLREPPHASLNALDMGRTIEARTVAGPSPVAQIQDVIGQYQAAYNALDASAAKAVWPSLDERALAKAFAGLSAQRVMFQPCTVDIKGNQAVASCRGSVRYTGRVGDKRTRLQQREWEFALRKSTDAWQIQGVRVE